MAVLKSCMLTFSGQVPSYEIIRLNGVSVVHVDKYRQLVFTPSSSSEGECPEPSPTLGFIILFSQFLRLKNGIQFLSGRVLSK